MPDQEDWKPPPAQAMGGYPERSMASPWPFPLSVPREGGIVRNVHRPPGSDVPAPSVRGEIARKRESGELPEVVRRRPAKAKKRHGLPETTIDLGWVSPAGTSSDN